MTTIIVIPTYNEAENIPAITAELFTLDVDEEIQILIVDDNSPDGTGRIVDEPGCDHDLVAALVEFDLHGAQHFDRILVGHLDRRLQTRHRPFEVTVITPSGNRFGPYRNGDVQPDTLTGEGTLFVAHFDPGPFTDDKPVPVDVPGSRRLLGLVISRRQRFHGAKATDGESRDDALGAADPHTTAIFDKGDLATNPPPAEMVGESLSPLPSPA